jgi:O-antigen/teichoic acid export membrane protein
MFLPVRLNGDTTGSMVKRGSLSTLGVLFQSVVRFGTNATVGRLGGPAVLGNFASAISTAQLLTLLWPSSTGSAASKFIARSRGKGNPDETAAVAAHLAKRTLQSALLLAVAAFPIWVVVGQGNVSAAAAVSLLVLTYSGYSFTRGVLFGAGQVARATGWDIATGVLGMLGVLVALLAGVRGIFILVPLSVAYLIFSVAGWPWRAKGRLDLVLRHELDGFVALGVLGTLASSGFLQLSTIFVRVGEGAAEAGHYAAALALATPPSVLAGSLSMVLFPAMAESWGRGDHAAFRRQTDLATRVLVVVMVAVFGVLVLCSRLIVILIWGESFSAAANLLPVLLVAIMINALSVASVNSITTRSQRGMVISASSSLVGMITGICVWFALLPRIGALGVAIGYLFGTVLIGGIPIAVAWRLGRQRWAGLAVRTAAGLVLMVSMLWLERGGRLSYTLEPAFALAFLMAWLVMIRRDAHRVVRLLLNRNWSGGRAGDEPLTGGTGD